MHRDRHNPFSSAFRTDSHAKHICRVHPQGQPESMKGHRYIASRIHRACMDLVSVYIRKTCRCIWAPIRPNREMHNA